MNSSIVELYVEQTRFIYERRGISHGLNKRKLKTYKLSLWRIMYNSKLSSNKMFHIFKSQ